MFSTISIYIMSETDEQIEMEVKNTVGDIYLLKVQRVKQIESIKCL